MLLLLAFDQTLLTLNMLEYFSITNIIDPDQRAYIVVVVGIPVLNTHGTA